MAGTVGKINVSITADNKGLNAGLRQAETQVEKSTRKMQQSIDKNIKFAAAFTKGLAALGALEAGLKGMKAITRAFKGDLEGTNEALAQMPMGIGAVATATQDLAREWMGVNDQIEKANIERGKWQQRKGAQRGANRLIEQLQQQATLGGIEDPQEKKLEAARLRMKSTLEKVRGVSGLAKGQKSLVKELAKEIFGQDVSRVEKSREAKLAAEQEKTRQANQATQGGAADLIRQLGGQVKLGGIDDPKQRSIEAARQRMDEGIRKIDELTAGGGKFKEGQAKEIERLLAQKFGQEVKAINKVKDKDKKKRLAGDEAGFESVGLTRSRLSGRGGPLEIVRDKPPTKKGQMDMVDALRELVRLGQRDLAVARAG